MWVVIREVTQAPSPLRPSRPKDVDRGRGQGRRPRTGQFVRPAWLISDGLGRTAPRRPRAGRFVRPAWLVLDKSGERRRARPRTGCFARQAWLVADGSGRTRSRERDRTPATP